MTDWLSPFLAQAGAPNPILQTVDTLARTPLSRVVLFMAVCTVLRFLLLPKLMNTPRHLRTGGYSFLRFLNETLDAVIYAGGIVFLILRPFGIQTFYIPSGSMLDTLQINDFIVANKWVYRAENPKSGDIVVFRPPLETVGADEAGKDYIKRCIGTPGQVIEVRDGFLYRDGKRIKEQYVNRDGGRAMFDFKLVKDGEKYIPLSIMNGVANVDPTFTAKPFLLDFGDDQTQNRLMALPPTAVPEGYFLMMGDNRNGSFDSRAWGLVPRRNIIGKSEWIWMPVNRFRKTPAETGTAE